MKKMELLHVHGLLGELRSFIEDEQDTTIEAPEYNEVGVKPTSIHSQKDDHEEAVHRLSEALAEFAEENTEERERSEAAEELLAGFE